jgi:hypothetical protein
LVGVGEHLQRVGAFEFVGRALEVQQVVVVKIVEHAAQVRRLPVRLGRAAHDHRVDAARLAREGELRQHVPEIARQQALQQQDQQRVPRRAQVQRIVDVGRGAGRHEAAPSHARCHDTRS